LVGGQAGRELYFGGVALPRQCIPVHLDDRAWSTQLRVQNVLPTAATATWQRLDANGAKLADGKFDIAPNGADSVPLPGNAAPGAVCIAADGPVSLLLVSQSAPGLLLQQGIAPQQDPVVIPRPAQSFAADGKREALIHNPGSDPVQVTITMTGAAPQTMTIPPHGTQQFRFVIEQFGGGAIGDSGVIQPHGPVVVNILQVTGNQAAALAPDSSAEKNLVMPVIETGANLYALSQLELTNPGRTDTMAIVVLKDQHGQMIWQDKVWVTAGATVSHPFWYKAPASAVLSVQADQPLTGTLLQHEVKTHWPFHPIGLSVALLPGYALGGYPGALATVSLFAALLVVTVYSLMRWVGIQPRRALIVAAIMAFSPPISTYAVQLYPDLAGTLLLLVGLLGVLSWRAGRWWGAVAGGLGIALAPFFHTRLLPLSVLIVVVLIVTMVIAGLRRASLRRRVASLGLLGAVVIVLGALLAVVVLSEQRFRASYLERYFAPRGIGQHALGILFDRTSGLLPYMPVLLIATAGFYWLARRAPYLGFTVLGVVGAQLLLAAARHDGWEVWGPPARYILPAVPFAALALGAVWEWSFGRLRRGLAVALAGWGLVTTTFAAWFPLGLYYTTAHYSFGDQLVRGLTGGNPLDLFPVIQVVHPPTRAVTASVVLMLVGGALLGLRLVRSRPRRLPELAPAPELAGKAADRA
ncbi:MAG TPA: hypothetical protein VFU78_17370, partial [Thermomicrobiales bacterium]|nr:hypothetical protein [Thermomicrobiales bacterium]